MKCIDCPHYRSLYMINSCDVTCSENFYPSDNCNLVNDDGTLNYDNEWVKLEYGKWDAE